MVLLGEEVYICLGLPLVMLVVGDVVAVLVAGVELVTGVELMAGVLVVGVELEVVLLLPVNKHGGLPIIDRNSSLTRLFGCCFTDEIWDLLVEGTKDNSTSQHAHPWYDTVPEAFVGILTVMGIVVLPQLELYWITSYPLIATCYATSEI